VADIPVAAGGVADRLPVIAAGSADDPKGPVLAFGEIVEVGKTAAQLEGAGRSVVLVLDPDFRTELRLEQRPGVLRSRRHRLVNDRRGVLELLQPGQEIGHVVNGKPATIAPPM
jgi:hypothetical protein